MTKKVNKDKELVVKLDKAIATIFPLKDVGQKLMPGLIFSGKKDERRREVIVTRNSRGCARFPI